MSIIRSLLIENLPWIQLVDDPKSCFDAAKNQAASSLRVGATFFYSSYMRAKTTMGLDPFEGRFFSGEKFTNINLALEVVIRNHSKTV